MHFLIQELLHILLVKGLHVIIWFISRVCLGVKLLHGCCELIEF